MNKSILIHSQIEKLRFSLRLRLRLRHANSSLRQASKTCHHINIHEFQFGVACKDCGEMIPNHVGGVQ